MPNSMTQSRFKQSRLQTSPISSGHSTGNTGKHMTKKNAETAPAPIQRTSAGLRDAIFDEIDSVRNGTSNPTRANAIAKLATGIVETVRMEIEVQRHLKQHAGNAPTNVQAADMGVPLQLGKAA
jgi:hypothetical protein